MTRPGRDLRRAPGESGFLGSRVPGGSKGDMRNLNLGASRNIITDWTSFKIDHPMAAKVVKYSGWLLAASATTGGSVLLSTEISKLLRANERNITETEIEYHIQNFTAQFDEMIEESMNEFDRKPHPGIFDHYFGPISRVKRNDKVIDFQFDFARVPPLPAETTTKAPKTYVNSKITHSITTDLPINNEPKISSDEFIKEIIPDDLIETIEPIEELPKLEEPLNDTVPLRFSLILIIVGAVTIVILAIIISGCFCYGCKSREKRYMNRDTVRAHNQNSNLPNNGNTQTRTPVSSRETKSSQAPTINLPNDSFEFDQPIGLFNETMQERYLPSIVGPSNHGTIGTSGQRRFIPYF